MHKYQFAEIFEEVSIAPFDHVCWRRISGLGKLNKYVIRKDLQPIQQYSTTLNNETDLVTPVLNLKLQNKLICYGNYTGYSYKYGTLIIAEPVHIQCHILTLFK